MQSFRNIGPYTRNVSFYDDFPHYALYRHANHSDEWLKAKVVQSFSDENFANKQEKNMKKKENFRFSFEDFYNHREEFDKLFEPVQPVQKTLSLADKNRLLNQAMKGGS